jgi:hypothetical protein
MGVLGVLLVCVLVSAALSSELRERYAALLRALAAALSAALLGAQPAAQRSDAGGGVAGGVSLSVSGAAPLSSPRSAGVAQPLPALPAGAVEAWSVADVGAWLRCIELGEHAAAFAAASVDGALLLDLTPEELRALGVASPLHAKKIRLRLLLATAAAQQVRRRGLSLCARACGTPPSDCYARVRRRA